MINMNTDFNIGLRYYLESLSFPMNHMCLTLAKRMNPLTQYLKQTSPKYINSSFPSVCTPVSGRPIRTSNCDVTSPFFGFISYTVLRHLEHNIFIHFVLLDNTYLKIMSPVGGDLILSIKKKNDDFLFIKLGFSNY